MSVRGNRRSPCAWSVVSQAANRIYCGSYHGSIVERVRSSGQVTGRVLQSQRGNVGTLQVSADGRDLVDFGATLEASIERWRIDGAGAIATLHAPGKILMGGYGPTGDELLVAPRPPGGDWTERRSARRRCGRQQRVMARTGRCVLSRPMPTASSSGPGPSWPGQGTAYRLLDERTGAMKALTSIRPGATLLGTAVGGRLALVGYEQRSRPSTRQRTRSSASRSRCAATPPRRPRRRTCPASSSTSYPTDFDKDAVTDVFDGRTGKRIAKPLTGWRISATAGDVVALAIGPRVLVYDARTMTPRTELAGITAEPAGLQLSSDGRLLLATSRAGTVSLYDTRHGAAPRRSDRGERLSVGPNGDLLSATLRLDGKGSSRSPGPNGVLVWNLDPAALSRAACRLAGRELTAVEWRTYASALGGRRAGVRLRVPRVPLVPTAVRLTSPQTTHAGPRPV